jgi:hypothetical protein
MEMMIEKRIYKNTNYKVSIKERRYTDGQKNCPHSFDGTVILFNVSLM